MLLQEILNTKISYQPTAYSAISKDVTIGDVLTEIKNENLQIQITALRDFLINGENEKYNIHKKNLPGVTFGALFSGRRKKEYLKEYTQIIVIDIDKLSNEELEMSKKTLSNDEFVFAFWESPSKSGLKGLVFLKYEEELIKEQIDYYHKAAFQKLSDYFKKKHGLLLDESGSDTTRLCFLSSDKELLVKENIIPFIVEKIEVAPDSSIVSRSIFKKLKAGKNSDILLNPKGKNNPADRKTISSIIRYLEKRNISITETYEDWYRVAYGIANTFTYDIGEKYFLSLCKIDGAKYDEVNSKNMLIYCYENNEGSIKFNTLIHFANKKGYYTKNQRGGSTEGV